MTDLLTFPRVAAEDLVLGAGVAQETEGPLGGAGAVTSVELVSEDRPTTNGIVKTEMPPLSTWCGVLRWFRKRSSLRAAPGL